MLITTELASRAKVVQVLSVVRQAFYVASDALVAEADSRVGFDVAAAGNALLVVEAMLVVALSLPDRGDVDRRITYAQPDLVVFIVEADEEVLQED